MKTDITFRAGAKASFDKRLEELGFTTIEQYVKWLIKNDIGIDA